jgi:hypothetical protein
MRNWLAGGDLRSDGDATRVAEVILARPVLAPDLLALLHDPDDLIRGRAAHAAEWVARTRPDLLLADYPRIVEQAVNDSLSFVRWHLAMLLADLTPYPDTVRRSQQALARLVRDSSPFVRSWAVTSLCIIVQLYPARASRVGKILLPLVRDESGAVAKRAATALAVVLEGGTPPRGWIKSRLVASLADRARG